MMIEVQSGAPLTDHADFDKVFRDWLTGNAVLGEARSELQSFLSDAHAPPVPGAIWSDESWVETWLENFRQDLPDESSRRKAGISVQMLQEGRADAVITGQQPGFLGGPLLTLYKVATAVVLAELRTVAGRPTVPVFWCGDDDDDVREALQPVAWDPIRGVLLHHEWHGRRGLSSDRMIGAMPASEIAIGAASWLQEVSHRNDLARDLADIWRVGIADDCSWARLQRRALLRIMSRHGLLVVHGNDPLLHAAASHLYERLWNDRKRLREAVRSGARRLASSGYNAPITEPSIQRFLHHGRDGRRQPIAAEYAGRMPVAAELRPGVVARSCIQDWLFKPAGVVVGPGEAAYLKQLAPVYQAFELPAAPLMPRLFAQAGPAGHAGFRSYALEIATRRRSHPESEIAGSAQRVAALSRTELLSVLHREGGVPPDRLQSLADQVIQRWGRYLTDVLQRELRRRSEVAGVGQPIWLRPEGRRQERALAILSAAALWGDEFVDAVIHACRRHVDAGLDGDWREYLLTVSEA